MKTLAAILLLLLTATAPFAQGGPAYRVQDETVVTRETVTLADVVANAPEGWEKVLLGAAPRPGRSMELSGAWVKSRASSVISAELIDVPNSVLVTRPGRLLTREEVEAAVRSALKARNGEDFEVSIESVTLPPAIDNGELNLTVRIPSGELPTRTTLWVDVEVDGKIEGRASARVDHAKAGQPKSMAVVLVRSMRRGEIIRSSDVELAEGRARVNSLGSVDEAVGMAVGRSISAGTALTVDQLQAPLLVLRGQTVRLTAQVGNVSAMTTGKALESGSYGEAVSVENATSGQVVRGVVRSSGVVEAMAWNTEVN